MYMSNGGIDEKNAVPHLIINVLLQVSQNFKSDHAENEFERANYMLQTLGLNVRIVDTREAAVHCFGTLVFA